MEGELRCTASVAALGGPALRAAVLDGYAAASAELFGSATILQAA